MRSTTLSVARLAQILSNNSYTAPAFQLSVFNSCFLHHLSLRFYNLRYDNPALFEDRRHRQRKLAPGELPPYVQSAISQFGDNEIPDTFEMTHPTTTLTPDEVAALPAFRQAEKKYQKRFEEVWRKRNGKLVKSGTREAPTDFSDVIDLQRFGEATTTTTTTTSSSPPPDASTSYCRPPRVDEVIEMKLGPHLAPELANRSVYHLASHPGLYFLPQLIPPALQCKLGQAALTDYCEPPARTNHYIMYGYLPGVWEARDKNLQVSQRVARRAADRLAARTAFEKAELERVGQTSGGYVGNASAILPPFDDDQDMLALSSMITSMRSKDDTNASSLSSSSPPTTTTTTTTSTSPHPPLSPRSLATRLSSVWIPHDPSTANMSLTAAKFYQKLRWSTLGPHYNWGARKYNAHEAYRPIAPELAWYASRCVEAVRDAWEAQHGVQTSGLPPAGAAYDPDVALINYYKSGDTLGGHQDNVEPDLSLPIVTCSVGCDAILLVGYESKDRAPHALLVRSGDVVIMGGPARLSFHGVPRVLPERGVPSHLDPKCVSDEFKPYAEMLQHMRINYSVRSTREPPER